MAVKSNVDGLVTHNHIPGMFRVVNRSDCKRYTCVKSTFLWCADSHKCDGYVYIIFPILHCDTNHGVRVCGSDLRPYIDGK